MEPLKSGWASKFTGSALVPGDKSISHRSLIMSSQAVGRSIVRGILKSEDVVNTAKALRHLGVNIEEGESEWYIDGVGVGGLSEPDSILDMGNSGTGVRLMMGLVGSYPFSVTFTGDESLRQRPMKRVITPLEKMGVKISAREGGLLPLKVQGSDQLMPISYELPVPSAQVKSAILLAGLNIAGETKVIERENTRDHTELMMSYFGVPISTSDGEGGKAVTISGHTELTAKEINVPSDPSSTAFLIVAVMIIPDSKMTIKNVCVNQSRIGLFEILRKMGGDINYSNLREEAGEQIADIHVAYSKLKGIIVPKEVAPSMIDEYPILAIAASFAEGTTIMEGVGELRVKESDRLSAVENGLKKCGVKCESTKDSLTIFANGNAPAGGGDGLIETFMDHRIAMSFLVMGMATKNPVKIDDGEVINTSFPGFADLMNSFGAQIHKV